MQGNRNLDRIRFVLRSLALLACALALAAAPVRAGAATVSYQQIHDRAGHSTRLGRGAGSAHPVSATNPNVQSSLGERHVV